jgi:adenylate kinase
VTPGPRLVLLGRQGSGKGTQAQMLSEHFDISHLSTGKVFRDSADAGVPAGLEAKAFMDRGELVADEIVIAVVEERFSNPREIERGFVLDGFPRTEAQAIALARILESAPIDLVIDLDVPEDLAVERLLERGRADDTDEGIRRRLELYEQETAPLLELYGSLGALERVEGVGDPGDIHKRLIDVVEARVERLRASV